MEVKLDTYCSCSNCGQKAGSIRSIGKYVVELYPHETKDEFQLLCITCKKEALKSKNEIHSEFEQHTKSIHFFEGLKNVYRKAFHPKSR